LPQGYFDPSNKAYADDRIRIANIALDDLVKWLDEHGQVAIYDAANTEEDRRREIYDVLTLKNINVIMS
jgi:6-phosphofructo-2-kinase/fructose-2,6-biphosphatase 4